MVYGSVQYCTVVYGTNPSCGSTAGTRSAAEEHINFAAQHAGDAGTRSNYWKCDTFNMTYLGSNFTGSWQPQNPSIMSLHIFASNIKMTSV